VLFSAVSSCFFVSGAMSASPKRITSYTAPKLVKGSVVLEYPAVEELSGKEAWVDLSFMVNKTGQPFDIEVVDSSGAKAFVKQAVRALEKGQYTPATQNGKPIEARSEIRVRFQIGTGKTGADPKFARRFRSLITALQRGETDKASRVLAKLESMDILNLYEDAYLNIARFNYASTVGQPFETQLRLLSRALDGQGQKQYLPEKLYLNSLELKFKLEVHTQHYVAARSTYRRLLKSADAERIKSEYGDLHEQVKGIRTAVGSYGVAGEVASSGIYKIGLYKDRFSLHDVKGSLTDIKLQCAARRAQLPVQIDAEFKVPSSYGDCTLFIYGSAGSTFRLQQTTV
jgi:TonB family protein